MMARDWIRAAERQGWRVGRITGAAIHLRCGKQGCDGAYSAPLDALGAVPAECDMPHVGLHAARVFGEYQEIVEALRRRRKALGLTLDAANAAAGLTDGHLAKLESYARVAAPPTLALWAETLGLRLSLSPAPLPAATRAALETPSQGRAVEKDASARAAKRIAAA